MAFRFIRGGGEITDAARAVTEGQTFSHILFKNDDRQSVPAVTLLPLLRPSDVVRDSSTR